MVYRSLQLYRKNTPLNLSIRTACMHILINTYINILTLVGWMGGGGGFVRLCRGTS